MINFLDGGELCSDDIRYVCTEKFLISYKKSLDKIRVIEGNTTTVKLVMEKDGSVFSDQDMMHLEKLALL